MTYLAITHWSCVEWTAEMEALARDKYVQLIISVGASKVQMVRTGELTFSVVSEYSNAQKAEAAQGRVAEIRAQAADELPMTMTSQQAGEVFASG